VHEKKEKAVLTVGENSGIKIVTERNKNKICNRSAQNQTEKNKDETDNPAQKSNGILPYFQMLRGVISIDGLVDRSQHLIRARKRTFCFSSMSNARSR